MSTQLIHAAALQPPPAAPLWGPEAPDGAALSPSQITGYLNCSASWHYKYRLKLPETKTAALALGKAVHAAIEGALALEARGHKVEQPTAMIWHAKNRMEVELKGAQLKPDEDAAALILKAGEMARAFHAQAPRLTPAMLPGHSDTPRPALELELSGKVAGVPVRGIADCIHQDPDTGELTVVDFKTSSRSPSDISNAHRIQLATYAHIAEIRLAKIVTITKAKEPKVVAQTFPILASDREHIEALFPIVADAMAQGFAVPNRTSTFCSRKNCSFWRACQADYGGTVAD